ncbi:MAG: DUF4105 domain-containing protein [Pseudoxanthomonas sp.]
MTPVEKHHRRWPRRLLACAIVLAGTWMALAAFSLAPQGGPWPWLAALVPAVVTVLALRGARALRWVFAAGFAVALACFALLQPRQDRDWADDVARLLQAQVEGDRVVLHNVRNFDWRGETDYDARWETRQYDLSKLRSADLAMSYWMGPAIAHTLVSFGFDDGQRVVFSLEIRKERDESFSALAGFFRRYEQVLIAADERDILRVRSNVRGEDVYLYHLDLPPQALREAFLDYLAIAGDLQRQPRFYNSLTSNCTTVVFELARHLQPGLPLDWRLLLSGYFAEYAYQHGGLMPGYDYPSLHAAGRVTERARATGEAGDYSQRIRIGVPGADITKETTR